MSDQRVKLGDRFQSREGMEDELAIGVVIGRSTKWVGVWEMNWSGSSLIKPEVEESDLTDPDLYMKLSSRGIHMGDVIATRGDGARKSFVVTKYDPNAHFCIRFRDGPGGPDNGYSMKASHLKIVSPVFFDVGEKVWNEDLRKSGVVVLSGINWFEVRWEAEGTDGIQYVHGEPGILSYDRREEAKKRTRGSVESVTREEFLTDGDILMGEGSEREKEFQARVVALCEKFDPLFERGCYHCNRLQGHHLCSLHRA